MRELAVGALLSELVRGGATDGPPEPFDIARFARQDGADDATRQTRVD